MKQIIVVKPQTLNPKDKEKLSKGGYIVVEHPMPSEFRIVHYSEIEDTNLVLLSAMEAINSLFPKEDFSRILAKRILEKGGL